MTVRERMLALRLLEKQEANREYTDKIGVRVTMSRKSQVEELDQRRVDYA